MAASFKHLDSLRLFLEVKKHASFSDAADALHMTKGAISYQMKSLEDALGFQLFIRTARGVTLTQEGQALAQAVHPSFQSIEERVEALKGVSVETLTIGMSTYFASRWLSPRLMTFMQAYPDIQLRIQPMTDFHDLKRQGVDIAIRWGNGKWRGGIEILPFMQLPAWPVGNQDTANKVERFGLSQVFSQLTLLRDHDDSDAWSDWLKVARLPEQSRKDTLIIPDPNVRVQAVINGQGVALNDDLVFDELEKGTLIRLSAAELTDYGYFLTRPLSDRSNDALDAFVRWMEAQKI